jgi:altronate hydrolase
MKHKVLKVHPADNVIVALSDLQKGDTVGFQGEEYVMQDRIMAKHKFFQQAMRPGDDVIMYGVLVGKAQADIPAGGLMHTENVKHAAQSYAYRDAHLAWTAPDLSKFMGRTFLGFHRSDGRVGTANYWLFIPTVFCENRNLDVIREAMHHS